MLNDMRVLSAILVIGLLLLGCLLAKAFAFSYAWVFWPVGIIAVLLVLFCLIMSNANFG